MPAAAQTYSKPQAVALANRLRELRILNDTGLKALHTRIARTGDDELELPIDFGGTVLINPGLSRPGRRNPVTGRYPEYNEVSAASILYFLAACFNSDYRFRSGIEEMSALTKNLDRKARGMQTAERAAERQTEINRVIQESWPRFQGPKIEAAIPTEDSLPVERSETWFPGFGGGTMEGGPFLDPARSATGKTRSRTLRELQSTGLIEGDIVAALLPEIAGNTLTTEAEILRTAASMTAARADYEKDKAAELELARKLIATGLLTSDGYSRLSASYKPYELKGKFGLIPFCERSIVLEVTTLPGDPQGFYESVFAKVRSALLPDFNYRNLKAALYEDSSRPERMGIGMRERKLRLSFSADSNRFQHSAFYDFTGGPEASGSKHPLSEDITKAINKWLASRSSEYRLYYANQADSTSVYGKTRFGLLLMTQAQFEAWSSSAGDYFIFKEVHDTAFTPRNIQKHIELYDSLGLFAHLSAAEFALGKAAVQTADIGSYAQLLGQFPKMLVVFDWETGNLENPYEELTRELAAASRGAFRPENIRDGFAASWAKKTTPFAFDFGGRHYSEMLQMNGDWLDHGFLELIEKALKDNRVDGRWHYCLDKGQESGYLFLTDAQFTALRALQPDLFPDLRD